MGCLPSKSAGEEPPASKAHALLQQVHRRRQPVKVAEARDTLDDTVNQQHSSQASSTKGQYTPWHKDVVWLSDKSRCRYPDSLAFRLLCQVMSIDPIRDKIMDWLLPIDVIDFTIATGIFFSEVDMARYTNIIKCIIPDRRWLIKKLNEGYTITIFSDDLTQLQQLGRPPEDSCLELAEPIPFVNLVVRRNERFIPCNNAFAHVSRLSPSVPVKYQNKNPDNDGGKHKSRHIPVHRGDGMLKIICPPVRGISSSKVLKLGARYPFRKLLDSWYRQWDEVGVHCEMQYSHLNGKGRTVVRRARCVRDEEFEEKDKESEEARMFWCSLTDGVMDRKMWFRIDR